MESVKSTRWKTMQAFNMKNSKYINSNQEKFVQMEKGEKKTWRYSRSQGKLLLRKKSKVAVLLWILLGFLVWIGFSRGHTRPVLGRQILSSFANLLWVAGPLTCLAAFCSWEGAAKWKFFFIVPGFCYGMKTVLICTKHALYWTLGEESL